MSAEVVSKGVEKVEAAVQEGRLSSDAGVNLRRWLTEPWYGRYSAELCRLIDASEFETLESLFWEVIPFGTGGRRGMMGEFGSATINERTIAESAHGLAVYLQTQTGEAGGRAVVAHDTRLRSPEFARLTATTLAAHGLKVFFFDSHRATPLLSFAVRHLSCDVGVMISASHNPPSDNGFKAYWSTGGQILPSHDRGIIDCVYQAGEIPTVNFDAAVEEGRIEMLGDEVDRVYVSEVLKLSLSQAREIPAIFTPLHGVGETSVYRVLQEAGFEDVEIFEPHRTADGNFTNVPGQLPNPERPQVFDPVVERARQTGAELLLASDPDADRLGVAVRTPEGEFLHLSGHRIGVLLCDYILRKRSAAGSLSPEHYVVETLVTTPLIAAIAISNGVRAVDDLLVGFKYIAETMDREGPERFVFGAEESLGFLAGEYCRDKDAAIAALYLLELAAELRSEGKTLLDRLDELYCEHGYRQEALRSEVCRGSRGKEQIAALMQTFRDAPPKELAGIRLTRVRDYLQHEIRSLPENATIAELPRPDGNLMIFEASEGPCGMMVAVRPSGTEPKIKFYFFAKADCENRASLSSLKDRTDDLLNDVQEALSAWVHNVLKTV